MRSHVGQEVTGEHAVQAVEEGIDPHLQVEQKHVWHIATWNSKPRNLQKQSYWASILIILKEKAFETEQ